MTDNTDASFPKRFSNILFTRYPDWKQYQVPCDFRWQCKEDIAIEVPSRFAPHCPLRIEMMGDGIIISWAGWHIHCDDWGDAYDEEEYVTEALDIVDKLLSEHLAVVIAGSGAGTCETEELGQQLENGIWSTFTKGCDVVVISWNGTYDRGKFNPAICHK